MEKHLFKFGKNSLAIVIPKKWTDQKSLLNGSTVYLDENDQGNIVLSSLITPKKEEEEQIQDLSQVIISRLIGFHYLAGTTKLRLYFKKNLSKKEAQEIQEEVNKRYIGFEIVRRSERELLIEDVGSSREISIEKTISRIRYVILEEFETLILNKKSDIESAEEIVDRFYLFGTRLLNILKPVDYYSNMRILQMLELVSDMLLLLSKDMPRNCSALLGEVKKQFELSMKALDGQDKDIFEAINFGDKIAKGLKARKLNSHQHMVFSDTIWSIVAIAETGISKRPPKKDFEI